jgi:hypothetical protein
MEKRILGIVLSLAGLTALIVAAFYFMYPGSGRGVMQIIVYALLGDVFFFSGVGLVRKTR